MCPNYRFSQYKGTHIHSDTFYNYTPFKKLCQALFFKKIPVQKIFFLRSLFMYSYLLRSLSDDGRNKFSSVSP